MRSLVLFLCLVLSQPAAAVGFNDDPPEPTETTTVCEEGQVWDAEAEACVAIEDSRLDEGALIEAARELAYAGRFADTIMLLERSSRPDDTMVLTYFGFAHRRAGNVPLGLDYYDRALAVEPGNFLTRSYLGMAHVEAGQIALAEIQLAEIRARGGSGTWAEAALERAIRTGTTQDY